MLKRLVACTACITFLGASTTHTAYALESSNNSLILSKNKHEFVVAQGVKGLDKMLGIGNFLINLYTIYQQHLDRQQQARPYFGACGSLAPTSFPAVRYRVYIDYSPAYLKAVNQNLCQNAWVISKAPHNGKKMIVISSFAEEHYSFAIKVGQLFKDNNIPGASVQRVVIRNL